MKYVKLLSLTLVTVFAVVIQSEAAPKDKILKKKEIKEIKYDYVMKDGSDLEADIKKLLPAKSEITHRITEGVFGPSDGTKGPIIIVPYITAKDGKTRIMLLVPAETRKYNKIMLGEINLSSKGANELLSVFFDQADKDQEREIFFLCAYEKGKQYFYETAVYNWNKTKFERVPAMESKITNLYPAINVRRALRAMESKSDTKAKK